MSVSSIIIARNEENNIIKTINSIKNQTHKIRDIIIVNDGSTDNTGKYAEELDCTVVTLPYHEESHVGRPELGVSINQGLKEIRRIGVPDFILQMGADHELSSNYVSTLLHRMGDNVKIASGTYPNAKLVKDTPLGSGRIIAANIWMNLNNLQYPELYGFESWILYKYQMNGYQVKRYDDIITNTRPISMNPTKAYHWGKSTYALGGGLPFSIIKALTLGNNGFAYLKGYFSKAERNEDIAAYVQKQQYQKLWNLLKKPRELWTQIKVFLENSDCEYVWDKVIPNDPTLQTPTPTRTREAES